MYNKVHIGTCFKTSCATHLQVVAYAAVRNTHHSNETLLPRMITHTIVVLNSSSSSILVRLFVKDVTGVRIVYSNLTLVSTAIAETLQLFNTVLLVGSVDFTEAGETGAVTLLVMLMDTLQGLVYHGVLETRLHADTHHLSMYSQQCVAVCCSVLQCVAVCCSVLQRVAV